MEIYNKLPDDIKEIIDKTIWINYHKPIMDIVISEVLDNPYCCPICRCKAVFKFLYIEQIPPVSILDIIEEEQPFCWYCINELTSLILQQEEDEFNNDTTEIGSLGSTISIGSIDDLDELLDDM